MARANELSQFWGGHSARRMRMAESVMELDDLLHANRKARGLERPSMRLFLVPCLPCKTDLKLVMQVLKPIHLAVAALKLEQLSRWDQF